MVREGTGTGNQSVGASAQRFGDDEIQGTNLIAAECKREEIVALEPQLWAAKCSRKAAGGSERQLRDAVADQKIKDMMIEAAIETEATSASPLFEFRSHGLQLLLRWSTISNEAAFGTAYFILMAMARSPMAARAAFTDGSWTPRRRCSAPSEGSRDLYVSKWRIPLKNSENERRQKIRLWPCRTDNATRCHHQFATGVAHRKVSLSAGPLALSS